MFAFAFVAVIPGFVLEEPAFQEAPSVVHPSSGAPATVCLANNSGPPRRPERAAGHGLPLGVTLGASRGLDESRRTHPAVARCASPLIRRERSARRGAGGHASRPAAPSPPFAAAQASTSGMLAQGVHPKVVSERLGHASLNITLDTYSHVLPGLQEAAAAALDTILGEQSAPRPVSNR